MDETNGGGIKDLTFGVAFCWSRALQDRIKVSDRIAWIEANEVREMAVGISGRVLVDFPF